jgi:large subunit ribosomal protein L32
MANPKKRKTHGGTRRSRSHLALKKKVLNKCLKCGRAVKPHTACASCGYYNGRAVVKIKLRAADKKK